MQGITASYVEVQTPPCQKKTFFTKLPVQEKQHSLMSNTAGLHTLFWEWERISQMLENWITKYFEHSLFLVYVNH